MPPSNTVRIIGRYLEGTDTEEQLLANISTECYQGKKNRDSKNNIQLLVQLRDYVLKCMPSIDSEYLSLTRECSALLLHVR